MNGLSSVSKKSGAKRQLFPRSRAAVGGFRWTGQGLAALGAAEFGLRAGGVLNCIQVNPTKQ
jgi:hypothetical protein